MKHRPIAIRNSLKLLLRKMGFCLILLSVWTGAILVLGELACRAFGIGGVILYQRGLYEASPDPQMGYGMTPGYQGKSYATRVEINENGFRGPSIDKPRPNEVFRIFCVGDSFTFGMGVEEDESWPSQLSKRLAAPPGYNQIEVINGGVPGYNLGQYCRQIELSLLEFEPNMIVIGLVENDLEPSFFVEDGYLCVPRKKTTVVFPGKRWFQTHSYFYQALNMRYQAWMASWLMKRNPDEARSILFGDSDPAAYDEAANQLSKVRQRALQFNVDIVAVMFALSKESPLPQIVEQAQIPTLSIDLNGPGQRLQDGHPNAAGHAHFADQIAEFVKASQVYNPGQQGDATASNSTIEGPKEN